MCKKNSIKQSEDELSSGRGDGGKEKCQAQKTSQKIQNAEGKRSNRFVLEKRSATEAERNKVTTKCPYVWLQNLLQIIYTRE